MVTTIMDGDTSTYEDMGTTSRGKKAGGRKSSPGSTEPLQTISRNDSGGGSGGDGIVEQAQQKVGEVAGQVQEKAGEMVDQVRQQATSSMDRQKDQAAGNLWSMASAIRATGQNLRDKDQGAIAQVTDKAAEQVERVSAYLAHRDVNQILTEVQHFARRQPAIFVGGAFALGMIGARFLKSTAQPQGSNQEQGYSGQAYRVAADGADDYHPQTPLLSGDTSANAGGWLDRSAEPAGQGAGGWSGTESTGTSDYGATGSGYSGPKSAPPLRGEDPRVSAGAGGYSLQGSDIVGGTAAGYGSGYGQGYGQSSEGALGSSDPAPYGSGTGA